MHGACCRLHSGRGHRNKASSLHASGRHGGFPDGEEDEQQPKDCKKLKYPIL